MNVLGSEKLFKCDRCSKEYKSAGFLRRHKKFHCAGTDEDNDVLIDQQMRKYYCAFCHTEYLTGSLFNQHWAKCRKAYEASGAVQSSSSPSYKSSHAVKLYVCSFCKKGFSRLATYKCHLSCHENTEKKSVKLKSEIKIANFSASRQLDFIGGTGISRANLPKLPRIPKLSQRVPDSDDTFCKPPVVEEIDDQVPIKLVIQDVRHVEKQEPCTESTKKLSMPQLSPCYSNQPISDSLEDESLQQQLLLEEMRITDEEREQELPPIRKESSIHETAPSNGEEDVIVVEEQLAEDSADGSHPKADRVQASVKQSQAETAPQKVSSRSANEMVVPSEDEDVVLIEEQVAVNISKEARQPYTVVNVTLQTSSVVNLLNNKPFSCSICSRKFRTESTLRMHHSSHYRNAYRCGENKRVSSPPQCGTHKKGDPRCCCQKTPSPNCRSFSSRKIRRFECSSCTFSSTDERGLLEHKSHFHSKNFQCKVCKRTFRTRFTKMLHLKTHKDERKLCSDV